MKSEDTTLTWSKVFTLVNEGWGEGAEIFYVADVDKSNRAVNRVRFIRSYDSEGYDLRMWLDGVNADICLVPSWEVAGRKNEWCLERKYWGENILGLALYHRTETGDKKRLWCGCVFSNRTKVDEEDVVAFIERRQKELKKKRK